MFEKARIVTTAVVSILSWFQMLSQALLLITFLGTDRALRHNQIFISIYVQNLM